MAMESSIENVRHEIQELPKTSNKIFTFNLIKAELTTAPSGDLILIRFFYFNF